MNIIEVVILAGAQCLSPVQSGQASTEIAKVPCAVLVSLDQQTGDVVFTPPEAATNPQVIAVLARPDRPADAFEADSPDAQGDGPEPVDAAIPLPRQKPDEKIAAQLPKDDKARTAKKQKVAAAPKRKQRTAKLRDACGSYKAVWYTNKDGRRKYRCVRTG